MHAIPSISIRITRRLYRSPSRSQCCWKKSNRRHDPEVKHAVDDNQGLDNNDMEVSKGMMLSCVDFRSKRGPGSGDRAHHLFFFLLGNLHPPRRPQHLLDIPINRKLPRRERAHHEQPGPDARITAPEPQLSPNLDQPARGPFSGQAFRLVDLAEHRVGGLGDDGGGEAGHEAGAQIYDRLHPI